MNEIAHSPPTFNPFNRTRAIIFSVIAVLLAALSFLGVLDELALTKVNDLVKETLALLVVSRVINGVVSVVQTIDFKIPFISSAEVGQVLDPVNDAAERLSAALIWAIGSLLLQDILLKLVSSWVFKLSFLAIASLTVTSLLLTQSDRIRTTIVTTFGISHVGFAQFQAFLIKAFVVATIFRFIVPAFAVVSFAVSQALVAPEIEEHAKELKRHKEGLSKLGMQLSTTNERVKEEQERQGQTLKEAIKHEQLVRKENKRLQKELETLQSEREKLTELVKNSEQPGLPGWFPLGNNDPDAASSDVNSQIKQPPAEIDEDKLAETVWDLGRSWFRGRIPFVGDEPSSDLSPVDDQIKHTRYEIQRVEAALDCIEKRTNGEECHIFLADHRKQVLGKLKGQLQAEQTDLQEELKSLRVVRKAMERLVDIDSDAAVLTARWKKNTSKLDCLTRLDAGEYCDTLDEHAQIETAALAELMARLVADLEPLEWELAIRQAERDLIVKLKELKVKSPRWNDWLGWLNWLSGVFVSGPVEELAATERRVEDAKSEIEQREWELGCISPPSAEEKCSSFIREQIESCGNEAKEYLEWLDPVVDWIGIPIPEGITGIFTGGSGKDSDSQPTKTDEPTCVETVLGKQKARLESELVRQRAELPVHERQVSILEELVKLEAAREQVDVDDDGSSGLLDWIRRILEDLEAALLGAGNLVEEAEGQVRRVQLDLACIEKRASGERCDFFLAEPWKQVLDELKEPLEAEQTGLREALGLLAAERKKLLATIAQAEGKGASGWDWDWGCTVGGILPGFLGCDPTEEPEAMEPRIEEIVREVYAVRALVKRNRSNLNCIDRFFAGEDCDSPDVQAHVETSFGKLKERLELEVVPIRMKLAELRIEETEEQIARNETELACAERRASGKECGNLINRAIDQVTGATNDAISKMSLGVLDQFNAIFGAVGDMVERMARVLVLVLIENIVLPIIFLAIALKGSVPIARGLMRTTASIRSDTREALLAMDRTLPARRHVPDGG